MIIIFMHGVICSAHFVFRAWTLGDGRTYGRTDTMYKNNDHAIRTGPGGLKEEEYFSKSSSEAVSSDPKLLASSKNQGGLIQ